jgi:hypothetical protein
MNKILTQIIVNNFYVYVCICICICIVKFVIVVSEHVDLMPSEDGQLTETCKAINTYKLNHTEWC